MDTLGIVLVSLLGGALFLGLIVGIAALIALHIRTQKQGREILAALESTKASFGGIRQEIKTSQDNQVKSIEIVLKAHGEQFNAALGKINGEALTRASIEALRALRELSALVVTLKNLLVDHSAPAAELGPEEYGPSDDLFVKQGDTARMDDLTQRGDTSVYTTQFDAGLPVVRTEQ